MRTIPVALKTVLGPQRFIATHQTALMLAAALLLIALYQNARKVNNNDACRVRS
ncbi:hypothetical protein MNBD_GAMMA14-2315 [hydrothermal vent metagenome]|uniref:Uncharacterized protein n=1 Tax=hydrothermal vent metagenome TaxID=652676 RepID=A0A3B0YKN3_9ZZZZ